MTLHMELVILLGKCGFINSFSGNRYALDHGSNGGTISNGGSNNTTFKYYNTTQERGVLTYTRIWNIININLYHLAAARKNGTTSLYTNGTLTASGSDSHNYGAQY